MWRTFKVTSEEIWSLTDRFQCVLLKKWHTLLLQMFMQYKNTMWVFSMFVLLQLPKSTTAAHSAKEINPGNNTMALVFSIRILWYCNFNVYWFPFYFDDFYQWTLPWCSVSPVTVCFFKHWAVTKKVKQLRNWSLIPPLTWLTTGHKTWRCFLTASQAILSIFMLAGRYVLVSS